MATLDYGIPEQYDLAINGLGYLLADEVDRPGSIGVSYARGAYLKTNPDLLVERQDLSHDMSENKIDGLYWSSQRSFWGGASQSRLDNPDFSNREMFLRSKNVDPFTTRGELTLSKAISAAFSGVSSGSQSEGFATSTQGYLYWATPDSGTPTNSKIKSVAGWGDTPQTRGFDSNWTAGTVVEGMCTDGQYLYVSSRTKGVFRGLLSQQTTNLTRWSTQGVRDIAFVKDRVMGHTVNGSSQVEIWEFDTVTGVASSAAQTLPPGWTIRTDSGAQSVFSEIAGFIAWIATNGTDGYLYLWDGSSDPFKAAHFPNFQAWGVVSYAETTLYVMGRDPRGSVFTPRWALIQCDVSASGGIQWSVLHIVTDLPRAVAVARDAELFFPVRITGDDLVGLTADSGISSGYAYTLASFNVANQGLILGRYWGLTSSGSISGVLWGDTGFTEPNLVYFQGALAIVGENGAVRREQTTYAPTGELVSSAADYNIDSTKVFILGELATSPLPASTSVALQYTTNDPDTETPSFTTVGTINTTAGKLLRQRLQATGVSAVALHLRLQLTGGTNTPTVRKVGVGGIYALKPRAQHEFVVRAYDLMTLRNGTAPWPTNRSPDTIQTELETLWTNQTIVDFQEPVRGAGARTAVKAQLREMEVRKFSVQGEGSGYVIKVVIVEIPDQVTA